MEKETKDLKADGISVENEIVSVPNNTNDFKKWLVSLSVVMILLIIGAGTSFYFLYNKFNKLSKSIEASSQTSLTQPVPVPSQRIKDSFVELKLSGDTLFLGNPEAPVTVVEFIDYQCPYCERYYRTIYPELKKNYIDTGKIKFALHNLAFLGDESVQAAAASKCASEQSKFWEYSAALFKNQDGENLGGFETKKLKEIARENGLESTAFNTCIDSKKYISVVEKETDSAKAYGFDGTPVTVVNNKVIMGAQPFKIFSDIIEENLKSNLN